MRYSRRYQVTLKNDVARYFHVRLKSDIVRYFLYLKIFSSDVFIYVVKFLKKIFYSDVDKYCCKVFKTFSRDIVFIAGD
jgi:hypothetical protein